MEGKRYKLSPWVRIRKEDFGAVIWHRKLRAGYEVNHDGLKIILMLKDGAAEGEILDKMRPKYGEMTEKLVIPFLRQLEEFQLVEVMEDGPGDKAQGGKTHHPSGGDSNGVLAWDLR